MRSSRSSGTKISAYFRGVAENELRLKRVEKIKAAAQDLRSNPDGELPHLADRIRELNASIVVMKRTVVLHLHRYLLSLKYRSSQYNSIRVRASPEMGVEKLRDVMAKVEARVVNDFDQSGNEQAAPELEFSTDDQTTQNVFPADWKAWLRQLRDPVQRPLRPQGSHAVPRRANPGHQVSDHSCLS